MKKKLFIFILVLTALGSNAQKTSPEEYIALYKDLAIREMKRMGVPAAITLAQGILESESGNSELVKKANNHFGIKCKSSWTAGGVKHDDDALGECFRQYQTAEESYRDHSNYLRANERYASLFNLAVTDYKGWAYGLKKAGYATNPAYPQLLIKNIEQYNLNQYTVSAENEVPRYNSGDYTSDKEEQSNTSNTLPAAMDNRPKEDTQKTAGALPQQYPGGVFKLKGKKVVFVKKGTSLLKIAEENNIHLTKLLSYNELKEDGLLKDDRLIYLEQMPKEESSENHNNKTHIVQAKESLYAIARKYKVSVAQLKEWNKLKTENISIGQVLIITQ
jgi:LysM repeat protein